MTTSSANNAVTAVMKKYSLSTCYLLHLHAQPSRGPRDWRRRTGRRKPQQAATSIALRAYQS
jgi:hypothetical protein